MSTEPERYLGEYRLIELVASKPNIRRWYAEQTSVGRSVLLDELEVHDPASRNAFLQDVKARAAVEHPLIASVYEAMDQGEACYFAHEYLQGPTLQDRIAAKAALRPVDLAHLIRRVAEAQLHLETAGIASAFLEPRNIHRNDQGLIRIDNVAVSGPRSPSQSARDAAKLGASLLPLVADAQPGSTRVLTLLGWMRGSADKPPLNWQQIRDVALQIEHQLTQPSPTSPAVMTRAAPAQATGLPKSLLIGAISVVALIVLVVSLLLNRNRKDVPNEKPKDVVKIIIPSGRYVNAEGLEESLGAFAISAHEVTIGEYAEFLERLELLQQDGGHRVFDHEDQPQDKVGHLPDDWAALLAAAKAKKAWKNQQVSLDTPVVGVDWWDATAYAEWSKGRLPTQAEWAAALRFENPAPEKLPVSSWGSITKATGDRTPAGIVGMAGSVAEWTRRQGVDPSNPLGTRKWVIAGGSYLRPGSNSMTREYVDSRSLRRADLGFRIVFDEP
jgi:hypothetical protein